MSSRDGTSVSIEIMGAEAEATLNWGIRVGTCAEPGAQIGPDSDYPELLPSISGTATTETQLSYSLSRENSSHAAVQSAEASRAACGDLVPR